MTLSQAAIWQPQAVSYSTRSPGEPADDERLLACHGQELILMDRPEEPPRHPSIQFIQHRVLPQSRFLHPEGEVYLAKIQTYLRDVGREV